MTHSQLRPSTFARSQDLFEQDVLALRPNYKLGQAMEGAADLPLMWPLRELPFTSGESVRQHIYGLENGGLVSLQSYTIAIEVEKIQDDES